METLLRTILFVPCVIFAAAAEERVCPPPPEYPAARVSRYTAEKAFYKCAEGYDPHGGSPVLRCVGGQWGNLTLQCQKMSCGNAGELLNGHFKYEGESLLGEKAYAICEDGYTLKGPKVIECGSTGWPAELPTCEEGTVVTCSAPKVANAETKDFAHEYQVGDTVTVRCSAGFQMKGKGQISCGSDGQWQPPPPQCVRVAETKEVTCSAPKVSNAEMKDFAQEYKVGDVVTVRCSPGFQMRGEGQISCGSDGQWQPPAPQCVRVAETNGKCGVPENTEDSNAHLAAKYSARKSFAPGTRVYYMCDVGYVHSQGSKYRFCIKGQWSPLELQCRRRLCGSVGELQYGHYEYTGVEFGDVATAVCDEGYQLVGQATRNCMIRGWDGHAPVCEVMTCDEPPVVANAEIVGFAQESYEYRTVVKYRCLLGSAMGPMDIWCTQDGTWSSPLPQCEAVTCQPPKIPNASWVSSQKGYYQYRDSIYIYCNPRYFISGPNIITCNQNGQWSPELPKCRLTAWNLSRRT